jgi:DNA polymerase III epsilon subunit-like protein
MKVYDKPVVVKKMPDGTYTISVALSDRQVVVTVLAQRDVEFLYLELEKLLKDGHAL